MSNDLTLKSSSADLVQAVLEAEDTSELLQVQEMINANLVRQDMIRKLHLSQVQNNVVNQMSQRMENRADEVSTKDLLDYYKTIDNSLNKKADDVPTIQVNNITNNVENGSVEFNRDSRAKILDAVSAIMSELDEVEVVDIEEEVDKDE
mgnify:CR=1 FL=1